MASSIRPTKNGNAKRLPTGDVSSEKLWIVLRRAYHAIADLLESGVAARGIAVSDFIVLEVLLHNGELTASEIAQKTRLAAASVAMTIARLKKQDLINVRSHRGSQQEKHGFDLTEQGRRSIDWLYEEHAKDIGAIFNILSDQQQLDLYLSLREVGHNSADGRAVPTVNQSGGLTPWQLRRAVEYMRQHMTHPVTTKEIAASIELSDSHFRKAFKIATGVSPHRWLLGIRISEAQKLLKEGVVSQSEIALATGFGDQSHFSRTFQRVIGVSPRVWQRDHDLQ
ncbi:helix-turn-helix domain-containing protein [Edaphobacter aggregans]|uniref:helix-turn-helix domain-containing protein n=1 Tax=Edaphobacter aggregans TaxID=570835 RepID=UPI000689C4DB|nr:helix-turn-helix domain-containing protein [Edaphobacter aggregans]